MFCYKLNLGIKIYQQTKKVHWCTKKNHVFDGLGKPYSKFHHPIFSSNDSWEGLGQNCQILLKSASKSRTQIKTISTNQVDNMNLVYNHSFNIYTDVFLFSKRCKPYLNDPITNRNGYKFKEVITDLEITKELHAIRPLSRRKKQASPPNRYLVFLFFGVTQFIR
ncbi:hypothetical protein DERF_012986 [Dermatophagoides farinae]|uniref:Uncharacterized protein n=1 Tax=Dermatophagoides farinae TaxID=6954 RepID=A0A922L1W4_DERFA|nr:hypothetical protein DERF_012986 [Dermatophagoides farinae]